MSSPPTPLAPPDLLARALAATPRTTVARWTPTDPAAPFPDPATHVLVTGDLFAPGMTNVVEALRDVTVTARRRPDVQFFLSTQNPSGAAGVLRGRRPLPNVWLLAHVEPYTDFNTLVRAFTPLTEVRRALWVPGSVARSPYVHLFSLGCGVCHRTLSDAAHDLTPSGSACADTIGADATCPGAVQAPIEWVLLDGVPPANLPFLCAARYGIPVLALDANPAATRDLPRRWPDGVLPRDEAREDPALHALDWPRARDLAARLTTPHGPPHPDRLRVALLLDVWRGLHHLPYLAFERPNERVPRTMPAWHEPGPVRVHLPDELATADAADLTRLVFLAHDHGIRVAVVPHRTPPPDRDQPPPSRVVLRLSARARGGDATRRHPTLREALASWWDR